MSEPNNSSYVANILKQEITNCQANQIIFYIVLIIILLVLIVIIAEIGAYCWHRFVSHEDLITAINQSHIKHHQADWLHEAHGDFVWIIVGLLVVLIILLILYKLSIIPLWLALFLFAILLAVFVWNWYIHMAYHQPGHWLEQYEWFQNDRQLHLIHHVDPYKNYGIASHIGDWLMNTYRNEYTYHKLYPSAQIKGQNISVV